RGYGTEADLRVYRTRLAKIRAKNVRSVLTCGGEFNSRHIVRRSGPKALDDPKSSTRPQSGEASSATDRAQVPWKGAPEGESPSCPDPVAPRGAVSTSRVVWECSPNRAVNSVKAKYGRERPIANKYREVKMKRTLKKSQRVLEIVGREADGGRRCVLVGCGTEQSGPPIDSGRGPTRIKVVT
ncbi:unnamed protein product, partial [Brassica napus]